MGAEASTAAASGAQGSESELQVHLNRRSAAEWQQWQGAVTAGPSARETVGVSGAALGPCADEALLLVGGRSADAEHNDVALFDRKSRAWAQLAPAGTPPAARTGHTAVLVPSIGIIVHGGFTDKGGFLSDTALLLCTEGQLQWTPLNLTGTPPCPRDKHVAVLVPPALAEGPAAGEAGAWRMVTFGGFGVIPEAEDGDDSDDDDSEEEESGAEGDASAAEVTCVPKKEVSLADKLRAKAAAKAKAERADRKARGPALKLGWFDEVHQLQFYGPGHWSKIPIAQPTTERPAGRAAHGACWFGGVAGACDASEQGASILVFGGRTAEGRVNDTWLLDVESCRWRSAQCIGRPPCPRSFHSVERLDAPAGGAAFAAIFGGLDTQSNHLDDLHLLARKDLAWARVPTAPGPAPAPVGRGCAATAAFADGTLVVFGGSSNWDTDKGGPTQLHNDLHAIELAPLLAAASDSAGDASDSATTAAPEHDHTSHDNEKLPALEAAVVSSKKAKLEAVSP